MNLKNLGGICKILGVSLYPKTKNSIIKKLLLPLKRKRNYRIENPEEIEYIDDPGDEADAADDPGDEADSAEDVDVSSAEGPRRSSGIR